MRDKLRGVERRVSSIGEEYVKNARASDIKYFGGENGPVSRRLAQIGPILGIAAGRFGELSDSGHKLVHTLAEARVSKLNLAWDRGEDIEKSSLAYETGYIRRRLSQAIVVSFGKRMLARMSQVGANATIASKRRQWWGREEERARLDKEGAWLERVQGMSIVQRGRFWRGGGR